MESVINEKFTKFLESNELLCREQHGFRSGRSCLTNLLEALENWTQTLDEGCGLDVVYSYLDYRKAFDSVPHRRLIEKLKTFGTTGKLLHSGAYTPIYRWRQMRHGQFLGGMKNQFWGNEKKFNIKSVNFVHKFNN